MLSTKKIYASLAAKDIDRARQFYDEKLGLEPVGEYEDEGVLRYECGGGTNFIVYRTQAAGTAKNTVMGWEVDDIEAEVADLKSRGVVFEEYDMPGIKTVNNIADSPNERAAWFKDSEGNILCVSQEL